LPNLIVFSQIVVIDIALAGDNAVAIGMAASGLGPEQRHRAIGRGIAVAALLRILFAIFAVSLLHLTGFLAAGGLLLLWVCWKMYGEIRHAHRVHGKKAEGGEQFVAVPSPAKTLSAAITQIAIADISMSLDNVLAVAGIARDHIVPLVLGLALSVVLMGAAAALVARLISRHRWISWLGLAIVLYTAGVMIWQGGQQVWHAVG
jgi:YjbE family integral membrane protein